MTKDESLRGMLDHARSIIRPEYAEEVLAPWNASLADLELEVQVRSVGANVDTREEVWEEGPSIGMYQVAARLADHLHAPDVEYDTDYMGTGKRAEALTVKAVRRLRLVAS